MIYNQVRKHGRHFDRMGGIYTIEKIQLYTRIGERLRVLPTPCVVGISGAYTCGKTVFAEGLARHLETGGIRTQIIHLDDFHHPLSSIHWTGGQEGEISAFYERAFFTQKLTREVLLPLRRDGALHREVAGLDWAAGTYTHPIRYDVDRNTLVLLEGVLLFRPPLLDYLDYKIFLRVSFEEMLRRGRQRDVPQFGEEILGKYATRYIPVQRRHLERDRPEDRADTVIDNNDFERPILLR